MTYLDELTIAKQRGDAWRCNCGAENPPRYDACHDCQRGSWSCATCRTVNADVYSECTYCGGTTNADALDEEELNPELSYEEWVELQVGPRKVGGRYGIGAHGSEYEVLAIERGPRTGWATWEITVRWVEDSRIGSHCTGWDAERDRIVAEPPVREVRIMSIGRLHGEVPEDADIALDLRHFRDPHIQQDLRALTANDPIVRDTVMETPGIRLLLAATALQIDAYLSGPTAAPLTVVTQCAGGRHRAATTAMALHAVVSGDVERAAEYGLQDSAQAFVDRGLVVDLVHRDLNKPVVDR